MLIKITNSNWFDATTYAVLLNFTRVALNMMINCLKIPVGPKNTCDYHSVSNHILCEIEK